jgi:hypothetical protein
LKSRSAQHQNRKEEEAPNGTQAREETEPTFRVVYPLGQMVHFVPSDMEKNPRGHGSHANAFPCDATVR